MTFTEQVDRLVELGYPGLMGMKDDGLRERLEPLRGAAEALAEIEAAIDAASVRGIDLA